jgi:hypothetical protein
MAEWRPWPKDDPMDLGHYVNPGAAVDAAGGEAFFRSAADLKGLATWNDLVETDRPGAVEAIYERLRQMEIHYTKEPLILRDARGALQEVRPPSTVLASGGGAGTCLDLALLFAGLCESKGLIPYVCLLEAGGSAHALVAVDVSRDDWQEARLGEPMWKGEEGRAVVEDITGDKTSRHWVAIEATGFARSGLLPGHEGGTLTFERAQKEALSLLRSEKLWACVNIRRVHEGGKDPYDIGPLTWERWLAEHLDDLSERFASHMAASALKPGAHPKSLYLDLVIAERQLEEGKQSSSEDTKIGKQRYSLEDVLQQGQRLLLLIGEGGCGKTTSLLYTAARAVDRARADETAPVPIFINLAGLTELKDVPDLLQLIADSVPLVQTWNDLSDLGILKRRRVLFLFDSFNEMPEGLQTTAAVVLKRFVEKQKDHTYLIGSRPVPQMEQLARRPPQFRVFEILHLTPDQVRGFLEDLGLGSLYDRMPNELRGLAGNPFMLLAIARTLAGAPEGTLPRNRGKLYESFAGGWMKNEEGKRNRSLEYSFERVKEPLLAYLAKRMTSAGLTALIWKDLEEEVEEQLVEIYQRIKRRGGMPQEWTVDRCLEEILADGLLKRVNNQLQFMHQSLQEYFTAVYFRKLFPEALVAFTPRLIWELVPQYSVADVPTHRFVPALLMMIGLLDDGTKIVEALAGRNPILAAAAASSASQVDGSLVARLEQNWLDLFEHDDLRHRIVGCSCAVLGASRSPRVIRRLVAFALSTDFENSYVGISALSKSNVPDAIVSELAERARRLPDDEYNRQERGIGEAIQKLQSAPTVRMLFEQWRASPRDASARRRFEGLMASVDESLLKQELERIRSSATGPAMASDAEQALAEAKSWDKVTGLITASQARKLRAQAQKEFADKLAETVTVMRNLDDQQIAAGLHSDDPIARQAAASLAAERHLPVGDVIVELIVRFGEGGLISPLVSLSGEHAAVAKLIERSREKSHLLGSLPTELAGQLTLEKVPDAVNAELERLGLPANLYLEGTEPEDGVSIWNLQPSGWSGFRPLFQLRASPDRLELYDCNVARRAFEALAKIEGETAHAELWRAVDNDDPEIQAIAIRALAERGDRRLLANRLLAQLRSAKSATFIDEALGGLARLHAPEAIALVNDALVITEDAFSDVHPVWGSCPHSPGWAEAIHRILATLSSDSEMQQALDSALGAEDPKRKIAALNEFSRWFAEVDLSPERGATWQAPERVRRVLELALRDPVQSVRHAAAEALRNVKADAVAQWRFKLRPEMHWSECRPRSTMGESRKSCCILRRPVMAKACVDAQPKYLARSLMASSLCTVRFRMNWEAVARSARWR